MVRLTDVEPELRQFLEDYECPDINTNAWQTGPALADRRVALISSAGLRRRGDKAFSVHANDYRIIPVEKRNELVQDHVSSDHDRTGYQQDLNTIFPLDRLAELAVSGEIGSVADYHYSFMGATNPKEMRPAINQLAGVLKADGVDAVVFCPV